MKGLFKGMVEKLFAAKVPARSIDVEGLGSLEFDHDEEAWMGSVAFGFGDVRLCLDGNWSKPGADGKVRPHGDVLDWAVAIGRDPELFRKQMADFLDGHGEPDDRFLKFLDARKRRGFDEIHLYKDGDGPLRGLVSYQSEDGLEIWRVEYLGKKPNLFYQE